MSQHVTPAIGDAITAYNNQSPPPSLQWFAYTLARIREVVTGITYRPRRDDAPVIMDFIGKHLPNNAGPDDDPRQLSYSLTIHDLVKTIYSALIDAGQPSLDVRVEVP